MSMLGGWKTFYEEYPPVEENVGESHREQILYGGLLKNDYDKIKYRVLIGIKNVNCGDIHREEKPYWTESEKEILQILEDHRNDLI